MMNPGVHSFPLSVTILERSTTGVQLMRGCGDVLTAIRRSCPHLGDANPPVSSRTIVLSVLGDVVALGKDLGDDLVVGGALVRSGEGGVTRFTTVL